MDNLIINTNRNQLDINFINAFISNSYWAKGRSLETMQTVINNSLCFGVYLNDKQIGFARVLTDYGQFAYIMDVFIDDNYRGKGYSKKLMSEIMEHPDLQAVKIWRLATADAHGLYQQFGFQVIARPENMMELLK